MADNQGRVYERMSCGAVAEVRAFVFGLATVETVRIVGAWRATGSTESMDTDCRDAGAGV